MSNRSRFLILLGLYAALVAACFVTLSQEGEISFGRRPWQNLQTSLSEMSQPSFLDIWFGNPHLEYKADDGRVLRVEDRRQVERRFIAALLEACWTTLRVATLGSLLGAVLALPLALFTAKNLAAPRLFSLPAAFFLNVCRSIHTLVFGLFFVGVIGLGATAGIVAIAAHSLGTFGKLYAEAIETLDMAAVDAVRAVGASPAQTFFNAAWPAVLPQFVSSSLYVWEFNIRDSTVLGLVGAGGLGLLISEAMSLFQWGRLATILIAIIALVVLFDALSRRIRQSLL